MNLLGLDVGTTGCKALVFDERGTILGQGFHEYAVLHGEPGKAEQDAEQVWMLTCQVMRQAIQSAGVREIQALSVSVQGDAIIPVDGQFRALHPALLGMDYRSQPQVAECEGLLGSFELFQRTGMRPHPMNSLCKALWLRHRNPKIYDAAWKIVTYADYILGKLGADPVIDYTMASRTMALDLAERRWSPEILGKLGIDAGKFSTPVASGRAVGPMRASLASELGLAKPPMLVTGGHDQPCASLGAGMIRPGLGVASTGTAEVLATAFDRLSLSRSMHDGYYPCYLHAKEGMYFTFALNHVGGILLRWFRDQFAQGEISEAKARGMDPYQLIDAAMPEGPSPVMVLPHFNGTGTPTCDFEAKGAVLGLTLGTTRQDLAKAILEGLTFELLINLHAMDACGIKVRDLVAVGGGAKSRAWLQIKADILNRPIRTLRNQEAACLGAALLAGTASGVYGSLDEATRATVAFDREYTPNPETARRYAERFATYQQLYPAIKAVNRAL